MCLERCNATAADIAASVKEFTSHAHTLTAVSFEVWLRCCCSELVTRCHINASWLAGLQPRPALHTCCQQSHACSGLVAKGGVDDTADDILVPVRRTAVCTVQPVGLTTSVHVGSYPPQFLSWMREVWANPTPFINDCLSKYVVVGVWPRIAPQQQRPWFCQGCSARLLRFQRGLGAGFRYYHAPGPVRVSTCAVVR